MSNDPSLRVRVEEYIAGALAGALVGLAAASPIAVGTHLYRLYTLAELLRDPRPVIVYLLVAVGAITGAWLASRQRAIDHLRGSQLYAHSGEARAAIQAQERERMSAAQKDEQVQGLIIGDIELARSTETGHILATGLPGSGKTVLLTSIVRQAMRRGDMVFLHDPKGDYTSAFAHATALLGPWDARAKIWAVGADVDTPPRAEAFARAVVGVGHGENAFFYDNARKLLAGLILSLPHPWTWRDLQTELAGDAQELVLKAATADPTLRSAFPSAFRDEEMTRGEKDVISTLAHRTSFLHQIAAADDGKRGRFSLREIMRSLGAEKTHALFLLNSNAQYATACEGLFGALLSVAASIVASADMSERSADARAMWFILDEFPQLGRESLFALQKIEEVGRSRGVRVVKACQDESQITALLGTEKAAPVLAMSGTRVYFRLSDAGAKAVSDRIGYRDVIAYKTTAEHGATTGKTAQLARQIVVAPSDLSGLRTTRTGVQMILQRGALLGVLEQAYDRPLKQRVPAFVESEAFCAGMFQTFDDLMSDLKSAGSGHAAGKGAQPPSPPKTTPNSPPPPKPPADDGANSWMDD